MQQMTGLKKSQHGLGMAGFLFVAAMLVMVAMLGMKLAPAYIEYFSVKKILASMGRDADLKSKSNAEIRGDFVKRATVDYVTMVKKEDLSIDRRGGVPVVTAEYQFRAPLVANISLVVDFSASSDPSAVPAQVE